MPCSDVATLLINGDAVCLLVVGGSAPGVWAIADMHVSPPVILERGECTTPYAAKIAALTAAHARFSGFDLPASIAQVAT